MQPNDLAVLLARVQAAYYVLTGVWPLVDIRSFEAITGPKADRWLVKTVGVLVATTGVALALASRRRRFAPELVLVAAGCPPGDRRRPGRVRRRLRRQAPHLPDLPPRRGAGAGAGRGLGARLADRARRGAGTRSFDPTGDGSCGRPSRRVLPAQPDQTLLGDRHGLARDRRCPALAEAAAVRRRRRHPRHEPPDVPAEDQRFLARR